MSTENTEKASSSDARQRLYEIFWREGDFESKAEAALELGAEYLGADNGHLTRIDTATDTWRAEVSTDPPDGDFPAGLELELGSTYCRRTIEENSPIALHDAPEQGWAEDPAFETHGLHCYHGTPLVVESEPYGTVCFVSREPRPTEFAAGETMFAELIARLLERTLERERKEAELGRQASLAGVLNRVLRHNLRNELNVVMGHLQVMADKLEDQTSSEIALDGIESLVELSEKARELESVIGAGSEARQVDVTSLVGGVVDEMRQTYPDATITIQGEESVRARILPGFERAIEELVENAVKHGGDHPTVQIDVGYVPDGIEIHIEDDGPGLSEAERTVVETGVETPLVHGSGLGLWLVQWVVATHDGEVRTDVSDGGTRMTISLPRQARKRRREGLVDTIPVAGRYRNVFESVDAALVVTDDDLRVVDANEAALRIFDCQREEMLGTSLWDLVRPAEDVPADWTEAPPPARESFAVEPATAVGGALEAYTEPEITDDEHLVVLRDGTGAK